MASSRSHKLALALGAGVCAVGAVAWWMWPRHSRFYTDADTIRQSPTAAHLRDILWRPPEPLPSSVNGPGDEVEPRITADGARLYFARNTPNGDTDLFVATPTPDGWEEPVALSALNTPDNELGPTPSPDGRWLYFASDRPGGLGGFDLWRAPRTGSSWGEPEHLGPQINSASDDGWPTLSPDSTRVYFASDRPSDEGASPGFDIYMAELTGGAPSEAHRLEALATPANEVAPACSSVGDFLYFASDREDGQGGYDLYRARLVEGALDAAEPLGPEVNSPANELDPTLSMGGFALHFSSDRAGDNTGYDLYRTTSREVFLGHETRYASLADLLAILPWILAALALVLLLSLLRRSVGSEAWRGRLGTLSLMAKCLLISLIAHAILLALLSLWSVTTAPGQLATRQRTGIALRSSALASAMQSQLRGTPHDAPSVTPVEALPPRADVHIQTLPQEIAPSAPPEPSRWTDPPVEMSSRLEPARTTLAALPDSPSTQSTLDRAEPVRVPTPKAPTPRRTQAEAPIRPVESAGSEALRVARPRATSGALTTQADLSPEGSFSRAPDNDTVFADTEMPDAAVAAPVPRVEAPRPAPPPRASLELSLPRAHPAAADLAQQDEPPARVVQRAVPNAPSRPKVALSSLGERREHTESPPRPSHAPDSALDVALPDAAPPETSRIVDRATRPEFGSALSLALPEPRPAPSRLHVTGVVLEADSRRPIEGATVRLDREGIDPIEVASDADGRFTLAPEHVPDQSAITASKRGYIPDALNVSERDFERGAEVTLTLQRHNPYIIALEQTPEVHHLGNDEFTGRVNSQFQRRSEGTTLRVRFHLDRSTLPGRISGAHLRLLVKGTQLDNPLFLNGVHLTTLPRSRPDGSFGEVSVEVPLSLLRDGINELRFHSVDSPRTDVDDYEFVNVTLMLHPEGVGL